MDEEVIVDVIGAGLEDSKGVLVVRDSKPVKESSRVLAGEGSSGEDRKDDELHSSGGERVGRIA